MTSISFKGAACALVLALALAQSGPAAAQEGGFGGQMVVTYKDDIITLDPAIGYDWQNWSMIKSLFDGLMDYEPGTATLRTDLAESYEISEDGLTFTFKIRPGVKFHNGRELTAEDVKYSIERVLDPATQSPGAGFFGSILLPDQTEPNVLIGLVPLGGLFLVAGALTTGIGLVRAGSGERPSEASVA